MQVIREGVFDLTQGAEPARAARRYATRLAQDERDLKAAYALRYRVFVEELGAQAADEGMERDEFDAHCDHILLVDQTVDPDSLAHVQGVYRVLPQARAEALGRFYCDAEFDLSALKASGRQLLELGRSCVAPELRGGAALALLWQGLAQYVAQSGAEVLFGAASFHGTDLAALRAPLSWLHHHHRAPEALLGRAKAPALELLAPEALERQSALAQMPALIRAYLRAGGMVGEGAYVDHGFNTTDVLVLLDCAQMNARHAARFGAP